MDLFDEFPPEGRIVAPGLAVAADRATGVVAICLDHAPPRGVLITDKAFSELAHVASELVLMLGRLPPGDRAVDAAQRLGLELARRLAEAHEGSG